MDISLARSGTVESSPPTGVQYPSPGCVYGSCRVSSLASISP